MRKRILLILQILLLSAGALAAALFLSGLHGHENAAEPASLTTDLETSSDENTAPADRIQIPDQAEATTEDVPETTAEETTVPETTEEAAEESTEEETTEAETTVPETTAAPVIVPPTSTEAETTEAPTEAETTEASGEAGSTGEEIDETTEPEGAETGDPAEETTEADPDAPAETRYASIVMIGDMLMHGNVSNSALQPDGSYVYDYLFDNIRNDIAGASVAIVNNEVILGGNQLGNRNYPRFNIRTELGDAEIRAGFDAVLHATNHTMDMGAAAIDHCIAYWKAHPNITLCGIASSYEEQNTIDYIDRNGIRIAILNYTYGLNGYSLPAGRGYLVNLMIYQHREWIGAQIREAKMNADFVIVCPHWGVEYQMHHSADQETWAVWFTENGADLILGTHSHCLQGIQTITASNGRKALCYYSLGNYVSSQGFTYSLLGGMAKVVIQKDASGTKIVSGGLVPLVTHYTDGFAFTTVYKLSQYSDELALSHGAWNYSGQYQETRVQYPLSIATFNSLLNNIGLRPYIVN